MLPRSLSSSHSLSSPSWSIPNLKNNSTSLFRLDKRGKARLKTLLTVIHTPLDIIYSSVHVIKIGSFARDGHLSVNP